jgi:DNA-binding XRE family transcriptional regulator
MSRKPHEPNEKDRNQVTLMAGIGLTQDQIAKIIGVSDETLRKYYSSELDTATSMMNAQVAQNLFRIATSKGAGAVASAIFWMKTRGGWREVDRKEITGANGGPLAITDANLRGLSDAELATMQALLIKAEEKK